MDVLPYRNEKLVVRSRQDQEAIHLLQEQPVRVKVDGIERYATPLLRVKHMLQLHAQPDYDVRAAIEKSFYVDNCLHSLN